MILGGIAIFTAIDGIVVAVHVSGKLGTFSTWWIELALVPFVLVSVPILAACWRRWGERGGEPTIASAAVT